LRLKRIYGGLKKRRLEGADPSNLSGGARTRRPKWEHWERKSFIEVEVVDQVFDVQAAQVMGLKRKLVVQIHCGSRGLGHQSAQTMCKIFNWW